MNIVVTNEELFEQVRQELLQDNELISLSNSPLKRAIFKNHNWLKYKYLILLEKWSEKALRGKDVHKIYTTIGYYSINRTLIDLTVSINKTNGTNTKIILEAD